MQLKAIIAAIVGSVVIMLGLTVWFLKKDNDVLRDNVAKQEVRAVQAEASLVALQDKQRQAQEHANELDKLRQANARSIEQVSNQLDMERAKNYSAALRVPFDAGNNVTRWLAWWMCEKERAGSDSSGTCDIHATPSEEASVNFAQVHTPETARNLEVACESGVRDACEYVLVSFTWDGWHNLQNYLMKDLLADQQLYSNDKYFREVLKPRE
jgi:hypothetical protein